MLHLRPAYVPPVLSIRPRVVVGASETVAYDDTSERPMFTPLPWYVYVIVPPAMVAGWLLAGAYAPVDRAVQFAGPVGGFAVKAAGAVGGAIVGLVGIVIVEVKTSGIH